VRCERGFTFAGAAAAAADDDVIAADDVISDVISLGEEDESRQDAAGDSSNDVTDHYPAEVIVEGQQMNKVRLLL